MANNPWFQGQSVKYFSKTYQKYLPAKVENVGLRGDGTMRVDLDIKSDCVVNNLREKEWAESPRGSDAESPPPPAQPSGMDRRRTEAVRPDEGAALVVGAGTASDSGSPVPSLGSRTPTITRVRDRAFGIRPAPETQAQLRPPSPDRRRIEPSEGVAAAAMDRRESGNLPLRTAVAPRDDRPDPLLMTAAVGQPGVLRTPEPSAYPQEYAGPVDASALAPRQGEQWGLRTNVRCAAPPAAGPYAVTPPGPQLGAPGMIAPPGYPTHPNGALAPPGAPGLPRVPSFPVAVGLDGALDLSQCPGPPTLTTVPHRLPTKLAQQYEWDPDMFLGKGAYAVVLALRPARGPMTHGRDYHRAPSGPRRAVKVVEKAPLTMRGMLQQLTSEVQLHTDLRHPHILRVLDQDETNSHVYLVLELATRTLRAWAEQWPQACVPERATVTKFIQVSGAVKYCHDMGVVHRDLTTGNVLLVPAADGDEVCKLADFGWACRTAEVPQSPCGSVDSWAPEIVRMAVGIPGVIGVEIDYWALGVMLFVLLSGQVPFQSARGQIDPRFIAAVCSAYFVCPPVVTERMHGLVKRLLAVDPVHRLGPGELTKALEEGLGPRPSPRATPSTSAGSSDASSPLSASCQRRPVTNGPQGGDPRLRRVQG